MITQLVEKEGWKIHREPDGNIHVEAYGELFPLVHPFLIHAKLYRKGETAEIRYNHFKAMHDYMWPNDIWHYWTERRLQAHCENWNFITYAAGASASKSYDAAKIAILFWIANPKERAVIIASTSLSSLSSRIWGYVIKHWNKCALYHPVTQFSGQSPKVLYDYKIENKKTKDEIHGMFAIAAKQGDDETVISSWIGRHPDDGLMLVLDEATDMPPALVKAIPNLEQGVNFFQGMAIGNSSSKNDLHGALSTPKDGWESVDPFRDSEWRTTQKKGICLFFSCYNSPAIYEEDEERKEKLSKFLITKEAIEEKEKMYGKDSDTFYRFVLGFWRDSSVEEVVVSRRFVTEFGVDTLAEWSGLYPLQVVAGLDPAFSVGGDNCVLRLAVLGVDVEGKVVLDFRGTDLIFYIPILAIKGKSPELQVSEQVTRILTTYRVDIRNLAIDANGQGRAIGEVLKLQGGYMHPPLKIYSVRNANIVKDSFDVIIKDPFELWFAFRNFISNRQIRGLDPKAIGQFTSRLVQVKNGKQKLESKKEFKTRMAAISPSIAHSPDEADAAALCLQSAILSFGFESGQRRNVAVQGNFYDEKMSMYRHLTQGKELPGEPTASRPPPPLATFGADLSEVLLHKDRFSGF